MLTIHVWPRRLKEFLLTHPLYKSPNRGLNGANCIKEFFQASTPTARSVARRSRSAGAKCENGVGWMRQISASEWRCPFNRKPALASPRGVSRSGRQVCAVRLDR